MPVATAAAALCLASAIYYEARAEPTEGQIAVAAVIMARVESPRFPDTVCGVVWEDRGPLPHDCQFSFTCDGKPERHANEAAYIKALDIADLVLTGQIKLPELGDHYFAHDLCNPRWAQAMRVKAVIGGHTFLDSNP